MSRAWRYDAFVSVVVLAVSWATIGLTPGGAAATAAAPTAQVTTVATGFDNPRGLAIGEEGQLYVAEAGMGGPNCIPGGPDGSICPGFTGAISLITHGGAHHRVVSGLASLSGPGGFFATGPDGLSRNEEGGLYTIITSCPQQVDQATGGSGGAFVDALKAQVGQRWSR